MIVFIALLSTVHYLYYACLGLPMMDSSSVICSINANRVIIYSILQNYLIKYSVGISITLKVLGLVLVSSYFKRYPALVDTSELSSSASSFTSTLPVYLHAAAGITCLLPILYMLNPITNQKLVLMDSKYCCTHFYCI